MFDARAGEFSFPDWDRDALRRALSGLLPESAILYRDSELAAYECDGLSSLRQRPRLVLLPETVAQVQAIVRLCREHEIPLVARGAGTGITGGARPDEQSVLLSLARFNRIRRIDPLQRIAVVGPGVRNLAVSEAAAEHGLFYAPDPSSQIACSIGGNVAENSGGVHCLKYGLTVHNVLGLKLIDADGELIEIGGGECLDAPGFDLLALMHGSEGLLGIVIEVTLRLLPKPPAAQVILAAFERMSDAGQAVSDIIASGIIPAGLEMMDRYTLEAVERLQQAGYPDADAMLLCELDGQPGEITAQMRQVRAILEHNRACYLRQSRNDAERERYWLARKAAFPAVSAVQPDFYLLDGTVPRRELPAVLERIGELSTRYGLAVANVFHAGDGNLHPIILYDANRPGDLEKAEALGAEILADCIDKGGSFTGEHGVGSEKTDKMCLQFGHGELSIFHRIKSGLDPAGILNPGKAIPSLHRCAELGAMHVHQGRMPHPELERF
jgi:glycolate oxidase